MTQLIEASQTTNEFVENKLIDLPDLSVLRDHTGQHLEQYEPLREIGHGGDGHGGMSRVYLVNRLNTENPKPVAIKVFNAPTMMSACWLNLRLSKKPLPNYHTRTSSPCTMVAAPNRARHFCSWSGWKKPVTLTSQAFVRLMTTVGKYWICIHALQVTAEVAECMGGAGYIEDHMLARLYREAPVNSIWKGSGNVQCPDVIRALHKQPEFWLVICQLLQQAFGSQPTYDQRLEAFLKQQPESIDPFDARNWVSDLAVLIQAALLIVHDQPDWAEACCLGRLSNLRFGAYG